MKVTGPSAQFPRRRLSKALHSEGNGWWPGPHVLVVSWAASRTIVQASAAGAPFPFVEAVGKRDLERRGPGARLSSSPQAEVSHIAFQLGRCTKPSCLPSNARLQLAWPQRWVHQSREGLGEGREVGGPSNLAGLLDDGGPFCEDPSGPQTTSSHHAEIHLSLYGA